MNPLCVINVFSSRVCSYGTRCCERTHREATARVPGHTLPFEGRISEFNRMSNGPGKGSCSCGATSTQVLPNTANRKRWHREHKREVLER